MVICFEVDIIRLMTILMSSADSDVGCFFFAILM